MSLGKMVADKSFRQDLLYRINTVELKLPALRDRPGDAPLLVKHFAQYYAGKYNKSELLIDKQGLEKLSNYHWPGNVRELQHTIERAVILSEGGELPNAELIAGVANIASPDHEPETLAEMEKEFILKKLAAEGGNVTKTASALGLTRTALYRRMNKHGLL
jgi:DNA-binding NtrC family response regulator